MCEIGAAMNSESQDRQDRPRRTARGSNAESGARFVEGLVAAALGVCPQAIRTTRRGQARVAFARQVAIYLAHTRLGFSYSAAGALFCRDRTTATYAVRTIEERREDPGLDALLDCLERSVDIWPRSSGGAAAASQ